MQSVNAVRLRWLRGATCLLVLCGAVLTPWAPPALANHTNGMGSYCLNGDTQAKTLACYRDSLATADADLNSFYSDVVGVLGPEDKRRLVEAQRAWIVFRDRFCAAEQAAYPSHPQRAFITLACLAGLTTKQTDSLKSAYWEKVTATAARAPRLSDRVTGAKGSDDPVKDALLARLISESTPDGEIAVARVPGTDVLVSYERARAYCGSGGCRPTVWKVISGRAEAVGELGIGFLPLVSFGTSTNGMPDLGLGSKEKSSEGFIYPVVRSQFNGQEYVSDWENTLPEGSGTPLITYDDLRPVR
ncbi:lysozyme inhibitor LprI family protein [Kamptonema cortianum]|nr:lysozyme inhibitor LprI family protein [Kamptonema cortianum]